MPRVSKVSWPKMHLDYGYMFHIKTYSELLDYWTVSRSGSIKRGVAKALKVAQGEGHVTTGDAFMAYAAIKYGGGLQDAAKQFDNVLRQMIRTLDTAGELFVNSHGGYFALIDGIVVKATREVKDYVLPQNEGNITIAKWPGGTHWYARVDGTDIEMHGQTKWLSEIGAKNAAIAWCEERGMKGHVV